MSTQHWGEIPSKEENFTPDVTEDIEKSMNKFSLAIFNDFEDDIPKKTEHIRLPVPDPLILYSIRLHKHINDVTEMIRVAELAKETNLIAAEDAVPEMPEMPEVVFKHKLNTLNFIPKEFTPFSVGEDVDLPVLNEAIVRNVSTKCVAILFAHIGFETTHQSVLDFMTDVLDSFCKKICHQLKVAVEDMEEHNVCGFPHIIERVLVETGMGGIKGLHDYYQCRVIKYIDILQKRCKDVEENYKTLLIPKCPSPLENPVFRVKVEEEDNTEDNSEVHFSSLDGSIGLSTLETGFQLLNRLEAGEAEANLQSLVESEEDLNVSAASPEVPITSEADVSHLSPFTKKKKFK